MTVKMFLMWNSKMLIDGGGEEPVETSLLEASNLVVLRVNCLLSLCILWSLLLMIHSYMTSILSS